MCFGYVVADRVPAACFQKVVGAICLGAWSEQLETSICNILHVRFQPHRTARRMILFSLGFPDDWT